MNTRRLVPLYCSATLFLTALTQAQPASPAAAPGPALAPPTHRAHPLTPQEQELLQRYDQNGDGKLDAAELDLAHGAAYQAKLGRDMLARQLYDRLLEQFDPGHEGKLNPDQQKQAVDFLQANRPRVYELLIRQYDKNGDGKLDANETTALFQYLSNLPSELGAVPSVNAQSATGGARPPAPSPPSASLATPVPDLAASLEAVPAAPPPKMKGDKARGGAIGARFYGVLLEKFDHAKQGSLTPAEQAEAVTYLSGNNPRLFARLLTRFDRDGDGRLDAAETTELFARLAKLAAKAGQAQ